MTMQEKPEHVHHAACAFGAPDCPAFAEPREPKKTLRNRIFTRLHFRKYWGNS